MIFKSIDNIASRKEISFFIEKIVLYTKIVKLIAVKNSIPIDNKSFTEINKSTTNELISIGVISKSNDTSILQKQLGKDLYNEFIISVNFRLKHKEKIGVSLNKLNNFERNTYYNIMKIKLLELKFVLLVFLLTSVSAQCVFAQQRFNLVGTVVDKAGESIIGANIKLKEEQKAKFTQKYRSI